MSSSTIAGVERDEVARTSAVDFARRLAGRWQEKLGTDLLGSYLIGSLAHAGFSYRYSDIDIALVTAAGLSADVLGDLRSEAVALSPEWGTKVSVFWADRDFSLGRFLPLDRIDYLDHAITLTERERVRPPPDPRSKRFGITWVGCRFRAGPNARASSRRQEH